MLPPSKDAILLMENGLSAAEAVLPEIGQGGMAECMERLLPLSLTFDLTGEAMRPRTALRTGAGRRRQNHGRPGRTCRTGVQDHRTGQADRIGGQDRRPYLPAQKTICAAPGRSPSL